MAEINLKSLVQDYKREALEDTQEKLREGEYVPGKVYTQQFPDDIADVIESILFLQDAEEVTFKVKKDADDYHVTFEVISKK